MDQSFRQCFCWNETENQWCGGYNLLKVPACQEVISTIGSWTVPALLIAIVMLLFPCFFALGRYCCNCCGGRDPSAGCCCPSTPHRPANGEEGPGRVYHNTSIFIAKCAWLLCFSGLIYFSIGVFTTTHSVSADVKGLTGSLRAETDAIFTALGNTSDAFLMMSMPNTARKGGAFPNPDYIMIANQTAMSFESRRQQIDNALNLVDNLEDDQNYGRAQVMYRLMGCVCLVGLIGLVFLIFNVRRAMLLVVILMSVASACLFFAFAVHIALGQVTSTICDDYNGTFVPAVVAAVKSQKGCDNSALTGMINSTANAYQQFVADPMSSNNLCGVLSLLCEGGTFTVLDHKVTWNATFECPLNVCSRDPGQYSWVPPASTNETLAPIYYWANISDYLIVNVSNFATMLANATVRPNVPGGQGCPTGVSPCTIEACADNCISATSPAFPVSLRQVSQMIVNIRKEYQTSIDYLAWTAMAANNNCSSFKNFLWNDNDGSFYHYFCKDLSREFMSTSITIGSAAVVAAILVILSIRGMKRFQPMTARVSNIARQTLYLANAAAAGVKQGDLDELGYANAPVTHVVHIAPGQIVMFQPVLGEPVMTAKGANLTSNAASSEKARLLRDQHPLLQEEADASAACAAQNTPVVVQSSAALTESMATIDGSASSNAVKPSVAKGGYRSIN